MANNYKIVFKSLREGTTYTVNIGGGSGEPIQLKGAANPFVTQEDDDDDVFMPIRTQSGYLRIVDDGFGGGADAATAIDWRDLIPESDTSRPVTLTDDTGEICWQGFMQAQNFSGELYGNPQVRDFPVQCALSILGGVDVSYDHAGIENFAYLLNEIVCSIPSLDIDEIVVQGGAHAQTWLQSRIDWMNFVEDDGDGNLSARYDLFTCLEDMCRYWGWTARTYRKNIYLTFGDGALEFTFLRLSRAELQTMAGGTAAGTTGESFRSLSLSGNIFASRENSTFQMRGPNKAVVTADVNTADEDVISIYPKSVIDQMNNNTSGGSTSGGTFGPGTGANAAAVHYTANLLAFTHPLLSGQCRDGYGSFNIATITDATGSNSRCVVRILKSFAGENAQAFASLQTGRPHCYTDGTLTLSCTFYRGAEKYEDYREGSGMANKSMYIRIGVGMSRATALWFQGGGFGGRAAWTTTPTAYKVPAGGQDDTILTIMTANVALCGYVFVEFLGSDDIKDTDGVRSFDVADFTVAFSRAGWEYAVSNLPTGNFARRVEREMRDRVEYTSKNGNQVNEQWDADCIFASENNSKFGYGVLINPDDTYMRGVPYGIVSGVLWRPEQTLADRVTSYWAASKRKMDVELRMDVLSDDVTPQHKVTLDGSLLYPLAISHDWWNDIITLSLIETTREATS